VAAGGLMSLEKLRSMPTSLFLLSAFYIMDGTFPWWVKLGVIMVSTLLAFIERKPKKRGKIE
jgi:hypothetical protein